MNKILFIDTLTTGMNTERCSIYRLGGIYTEDGVEAKRFELRMRPFPNARINENSLWISGETRTSLMDYESESEAFSRFIEILNTLVDVKNPKDKIYLAGYKVSSVHALFLREWFRRNGNERFRDYFYVQTIDTEVLATMYLINNRSAMPDFHLETAARFMQINTKASDLYDCLYTAKTSLDIYRTFEKRCGLGECLNVSIIENIEKNY